ncbi:PREDICTED: zinc finger protein OZF-like [Papilio xuthus]|uniref:Zinc finger protein OZF-like n=1 Tax=Papilio xuthus TaxID=66420 RepID=A0AAJ6YZ58_PAPXU|nr:PREDICTED: zinc finger protein OZF-like [Papilio xuthus]
MVDISVVCRTCMKNHGDLVNLFVPMKMEHNCDMLYVDALETASTCQVTKEDGLPQNICMDCANILKILITFRENALKSQDNLKKLIYLDNTLKEELKDEDDNTYNEMKICDNSIFPKIEKTEDDFYICPTCQKQYTQHKRYLNHLLTHEIEQTKVKLETDYDSIDIFGESDYSDQLYKCEECDKTFNKERALISHRRKHKNYVTKDKNFECDYCHKMFSMKSLLKRHLKLHSTNRPFQCNQCSKSYTRQDQLIEHIKKHDKVKAHVCSYCNKGFSQLCSLKEHLRVHTKEAPYLCSECGKSFTNNSNLRQHMIRHSGVKPFSCTFCPKTFSTKGQMVSHIATHTDAHPHKCDECGAAFTKPNSLKKHKFIHRDLKAFACDTCDKRFNCKDHLKRHQRVHTGEKPYRCRYCERAFSQSNDVIKHMRMHVGQDIYQCSVCHMKFRLMRDLKKHYPIHYINDSNTPTVPVGNGMMAPIMVLKTDTDVQNVTQTDIMITVNDTLSNGIIINIPPQET